MTQLRNSRWSQAARLLTLVLVATVSLGVLAGCQSAESGDDTSSGTEVVDFAPAIPEGDEVDGECFSVSMAVARSGAYRCSVESEIHDPCFAVEGDETALVCGANPVTDEAGFTLRVSDPLPVEELEADPAHAWLVALVDGTVCEYNTGATGGFEEERLNYGCDDASWILGDLEPGDVWTGRRVTLSNDGSEIGESETAEIETVWR